MSAMAEASGVVCEGQAEALVTASPGRSLGPLGRNPIFVAGHSSSSQATHWNSAASERSKLSSEGWLQEESLPRESLSFLG